MDYVKQKEPCSASLLHRGNNSAGYFLMKSSMKTSTGKIYFTAALLCFFMTAAVFCRPNLCREQGPLFFQVHFTFPADRLSLEQARSCLRRGKLPPRIKKIYLHEKIASLVKKAWPGLPGEVYSPGTSHPRREKGALLISDLEGLTPSMKTLAVEGIFPWGTEEKNHRIVPGKTYPVMLPGASPWSSQKHVSVVQTGVTAMTRAFIHVVEKHGDLDRPLKRIVHILRDADIATTSNEVSFTSPCRWPLKNRMLFCSPRKYFSILTRAGIDMVELTGNHNNDYGKKGNRQTINMFENAGIRYFGGGRNRREAFTVRCMKVKDTTFAFIGFNQWGPSSAWATEKEPGAARLSLKAFTSAIREGVEKADVVFVSVQWGNENSPIPDRTQKKYFHLAADMGAHIMVSSSAHRAMGVEFYRGKFISYGLGNFLFDQMQTVNHRRGLVARHHFYRGRHIETELIPYLMYNYSEPRPVYGEQARALFRYVFRYSRGGVFR